MHECNKVVHYYQISAEPNNEVRVLQNASRRPIRAVKKARKGCGHDVHNGRSARDCGSAGLTALMIRPQRNKLESAHFTASNSRVISIAEFECNQKGTETLLGSWVTGRWWGNGGGNNECINYCM